MTDATHAALATRLNLDQKARLLAGKDFNWTEEEPDIGLRSFRMVDGPSAVNAPTEAHERIPLGPCPTALAASWDLELIGRIGEMQGREAVRRGVGLILAPNVNLERGPNPGRAFEYFGEDPFLAGKAAAAWIAGVQSRGVGATAKHLVCNDSETQRQTMNAVVDERALREVYLLPFEMACAAGAWALMTAYNRCNGARCAELPLIRDIIRNEWKFDGLIVSDWHGAHDTVACANAGLGFEMPGPGKVFGPRLAQAVRDGAVAEATVDDAVVHFLRLADRVGALGEPRPARPDEDFPLEETLTEATAAGFVLLKNDQAVLPADPTVVRKVAIIGPNAAEPSYQGGALGQIPVDHTWATPLDALRRAWPDVVHAPGVLAAPRLPSIAKFDIRPTAGADDRGVLFEYFAGQDTTSAPMASEVQPRGSAIWFGQMPGTGPLTRPATVRASFVFTPETTGPHLIRTGGAGDIRVWADGRQIGALPAQGSLDKTGEILWPPLLEVEHAMTAGRPVQIVIEMYTVTDVARSLHLAVQPPQPEGLLEAAVAAAAAADLAVVIVGETTDNAMESVDRTSSRLPGDQPPLIERVCAANPRTVVVVNAGHVVDMPWADKAAAVILAWFPGERFGAALADVITGRREPGGRLPLTVAQEEADYAALDLTPVAGDLVYAESTLIGGRWLEAHGKTPRYALGHGLGYASFAVGPAALTLAGEVVAVRVQVRNTSDRAGKAVVQAYVRALDDAGNPASELKGFAALMLAPGAEQEAVMHLDRRAFSHWDVARQTWAVKPGRYAVRIGRSLSDITSETIVSFDDAGRACL